MIRALIEQTFDATKKYYVMCGLSTDTKPTSGLITGSQFHEVDTGTKYEFDEVNSQWHEVGITEQEIKDEIDAWLDDHPEATTTVQDGAISYAKLDSSLKGTVDDVADLKTEIQNKANVDGSYSSLTAGNAEQLVSTVGVNDKTPYLFRTTGGSADVGDRVKLSEITGGTVAWNQLVNTGDTSVTVPNGHKYYSRINSVQTIGASTGAAISINDASKDNVFDLTAMFGSTIADYLYTLESGTAGAGIAKLKSWGFCTAPYYAYDAGSLLSVKTSAHKEIGFNQWDEQWEVGGWGNNTGAKTPDNTMFRNKTPIKVVPNTTYYYRNSKNYICRFYFYDASGGFIQSATVSKNANSTLTTPSNAYYMNFRSVSVPSYSVGDICINLHWDGERDGEYEPYVEYNYPLDSDLELRGIPKLDASNNLYYDGDSYAPDGTVTRNTVKVTYDGSNDENWEKLLDGYNYFALTVGAYGSVINGNIICDKYQTAEIKASTTAIGCWVVNSSGFSDARICVRPLGYDEMTVPKFIQMLESAPITVAYRTTTPTTESADPYQETQVCNDFGTEEFVDSRTVPMPVGANALYQANLRAKLEMAPDSPAGDGDYIVRQTDGLNEYVLLEKELPTAPAEDGTYSLKCTVASGTATLSWVADE